MKQRTLILSIIGGAILLLLTTGAYEQGNKTLLKLRGSNPEFVDAVWFYPIRNEFEIVRGNATVVRSATEVEYVKPPEPRGLESGSDITALENILRDYQKRWWDAEAFKRLLPLYLNSGKADKAIRLFAIRDRLTNVGIPVSSYVTYWRALIASHHDTVLEQELSGTIRKGSREEAAFAYITRGDYFLSKGEAQKALVDGYLVVVLLFRNIESTRKEALTGTIAAYDKLGDPKVAEFRKMLKEEYP